MTSPASGRSAATTTTATRGRSSAIGAIERSRSPVAWRLATVTGLIEETHRAKTITLNVPEWPGHTPGQHVDVRLTAEDGYQTERSYSIASAPEDPVVALTVERIDGGEVSPYLTDELRVGDQLELRGPLTQYFVWRTQDGGPLLLIAGGSGLVPLMAMLRHRAARRSTVEARLLVSARSLDDVLYYDELGKMASEAGVNVRYTFTRAPPPHWRGFARRIDADMLRTVGPAPMGAPRVFICGPTAFVEQAADLLVKLGHAPAAIRTERFGPTG
jgi:ferredoxin-NADP reductase